jgi:hypothetical protein
MYLSPLWNRIFSPAFRQQYNVSDYGLVCVDVYSRYVKAVGMKSFKKENIVTALEYIFKRLGKPEIVSGDNQIIDAIKNHIAFKDIHTYATAPKEVNKNAIVERMIRTIKDRLLKLFMELDPVDIYNYYKSRYPNMGMTTIFLLCACNIINKNINRTIKHRPNEVFIRLKKNEQTYRDVYYPVYKVRTIVLKIPERAGEVPLKTFDYDPEPYVIVERAGRKYILQKMIDWIKGIPYFDEKTRARMKLYKPYEIRAFMNGDDLVKYLESPLVKYTLTFNYYYMNTGYQQLLNWAKTYKDWYTSFMSS